MRGCILRGTWLAAVCLAAVFSQTGAFGQQADLPRQTKVAWTLGEALEQLAVNPHDSYVQYVTLQMASREGRLDEISQQIERLTGRGDWARRRERQDRIDLFSVFTGALAVHESLQMDTMRGERRRPFERKAVTPPKKAEKFDDGSEKKAEPKEFEKKATHSRKRTVFTATAADATVRIADLTGPTIKSHPWTEMLAGKKPKLSPLAFMVPADQYYVQCRSLSTLLNLQDFGDLWVAHFFNQSSQDATSSEIGQRLRQQLAVQTDPLSRPFYDVVVDQVAITGSDLFVREGSDVTLIFRLKQPAVFRAKMDGYLAASQKQNADSRRTTGKYGDVEYVHVATPDRRVQVFSAYPRPDVHVRSNSLAALRRVLAAINGDASVEGEDQRLVRLGHTDEFRYIRTLMPEGAKEEDVFVYMSDPFIRHMVGPKLKLTERRRLLAYNHLRMIGHAGLLHQTQFGRRAKSLQELHEHGCAPDVFGRGKLEHPLGGKYSLAADGLTGVCSVVGTPHLMTPNREIPLEEVTPDEAAEYRRFLEEYNRYWRQFFDPIAIRVQATPKQYRVETIVLPLIDNSIYTGLARVLGGKTEPLDTLPVPKGNIFSVAGRINKRELFGLFELEGFLEDAKDGEEPKRKGDPTTAPTAEKFRQLALAMHMHHDVHNAFPPAVHYDKEGKKPLLSWRVHLLPYLEEAALYKEFRFDEPWDSEHNKKLIAKLPAIYRPANAKLAKEGKTTIVVPVGEATIFPAKAKKGLPFRSITDGLSHAIMLVEANDDHAVIWTKPDDLPHDPKKPLAGLRMREPGAFLTAFADGSVHFLRKSIDPTTAARLFSRADGAVVEIDEIALQFPKDRRKSLDLTDDLRRELGLPAEQKMPDVRRLLTKGLGNQVGLHIYDAQQFFDFNFSRFMGQALGSFGGRGLNDEILWISVLVASLNSPVYISLPVADVKIVDEFLDQLDPILAIVGRRTPRGFGFFEEMFDFYRLESTKAGTKVRAAALQFGPLKWRFFWARIGDGLYIASKKFILDDLEEATARQAKGVASAEPASPGPNGHAMVRIRAHNWKDVLPDYQLGWTENNRRAVLKNLGPLSSVARAYAAANPKAAGDDLAKTAGDILQLAGKLYGVRFLSPDGGRYILSADGKKMSHTIYGSQSAPKQPPALPDDGDMARLIRDFHGATAELKFLEDGLHAVLTIERK